MVRAWLPRSPSSFDSQEEWDDYVDAMSDRYEEECQRADDECSEPDDD